MASQEANSSYRIGSLVEKVTEDLKKDVNRYWDHTIAEPEDVFWRRGLVRAAFAYFEGLISTLKLKAILTHKALQAELMSAPWENEPKSEPGPSGLLRCFFEHIEKARKGANFSYSEIMLLCEKSYRLTGKGKSRSRMQRFH